MRVSIVVALAGVALVGDPSAAQDELKSDQKALQGAWKVVEQGPKAQGANTVFEQLVFKGDRLTFRSRREDEKWSTECVFRLNPDTSPKTIDFSNVNGGDPSKPYVGLYELKGGKLRICYRGPGSSRPKNFEDKADGVNGTAFITLEPVPGA